MKKKDLEWQHLDLLRAFLGDAFPEGNPEAGERPDFVIATASGRLGIEHTRMFPQGGAARGNEVEQVSIVTHARRVATDRGCPPLMVFVDFNSRQVLTKRERQPLGVWLAEIVLDRLPPLGEDVCIGTWPLPTPLPEQISEIRIYRPIRLSAPNWQPTRVGLVPIDFSGPLQHEISVKNNSLTDYLERCDRCWLLVVAEIGSPGALVEVSEPTTQTEYHFDFERVFFCEEFSGRGFEALWAR